MNATIVRARSAATAYVKSIKVRVPKDLDGVSKNVTAIMFALYTITVFPIFFARHTDIANRDVKLHWYRYGRVLNGTNCDVDSGVTCTWTRVNGADYSWNAVSWLLGTALAVWILYFLNAVLHAMRVDGGAWSLVQFFTFKDRDRSIMMAFTHSFVMWVCSVIAVNLVGMDDYYVQFFYFVTIFALYMSSYHLAEKYRKSYAERVHFDKSDHDLLNAHMAVDSESVGGGGGDAAVAARDMVMRVLASGRSPTDTVSTREAHEGIASKLVDVFNGVMVEMGAGGESVSAAKKNALMATLMRVARDRRDGGSWMSSRFGVEMYDVFLAWFVCAMTSVPMWVAYNASTNIPTFVWGMLVILQIWYLLVSFSFTMFLGVMSSRAPMLFPYSARARAFSLAVDAPEGAVRGARVKSVAALITGGDGKRLTPFSKYHLTDSYEFMRDCANAYVAFEGLVMFVLFTAFYALFVVHMVSNVSAGRSVNVA